MCRKNKHVNTIFFFLFDHTTPLLEGVSVHDVWCGMGRGESRVCSGRDIFVCCFFFLRGLCTLLSRCSGRVKLSDGPLTAMREAC